MKQYICILTLLSLFLNSPVFAQEWSEPVQINTLQGYNSKPDFFIADDGVIHTVWNYRLEANHRVIYYSKSEDDGLSWSEPENISQNTTKWMENPHVVVDTDNNIYISYDYNAGSPGEMLIFMRKYNGESWSGIDTVSNGWYGSDYNKLYVDNNDIIYCFWYCDWYNNGSMLYRYYENSQWSEVFFPYDNNSNYHLGKAIFDNNNVLHCSAYRYYYGQNTYDKEIVYSTYNNGVWTEITEVSNNFVVMVGNDMAISNNNFPQIVWRQTLSNSAPPNDGTLYSFYNGTEWSAPEIIVEDPSDQAIVIDQYNKTHIIDNEKYEDGYRLVHYQKHNNEWIGEVVAENKYGYALNNLAFKSGFVFLLNLRGDTIIGSSAETSIIFRKYEVIVNTEELFPIIFSNYKIYPNPIKNSTYINYKLTKTSLIEIKIYNLKGELIKTLLDKKQSTGTYKIEWNATDKNGKEIKTGLYLIRLKAGKQIMTCSVEVIK